MSDPPEDHGARLRVSFEAPQGTPLELESGKLLASDGTETAFAEEAGAAPLGGFNADISALAAGSYTLYVKAKGRPEFALGIKLTGSGEAQKVSFAGKTPRCAQIKRVRYGDSGETEEWGPRVSLVSIELAAEHSEVVLVAGWDYSGGARNQAYCEGRRDDLWSGTTYVTGAKGTVKKQIDATTVVTIFDFQSGNRLRQLKGTSGWHVMDTVLQGAVATHTAKPYKDHSARRKSDDSMSITHVYDYVGELGKEAAGTLRELSMFCHAYWGGPIMANTNEGASYARSRSRDPQDKDGRLKDFRYASDNITDGANFKAAFTSDAIVKVWGCLAITEYYRGILAHRKSTKPDDVLKYRSHDNQPIEKTAKEFVDEMKASAEYTYMHFLAKFLGMKVWGAPPGLGANLRYLKGRNYMHVNRIGGVHTWVKTHSSLDSDASGYVAYG